jgi:uncharacterized spore protein YtfJ
MTTDQTLADSAEPLSPRRSKPGRRAGRGHVPAGRRSAQPLRVARDLLTVRRAYGEPIQRGDVTIVPVARVIGGSGYGDGDGQWTKPGDDEHGTGSGSGGGFGVSVTPVGVYVVSGTDVTWQPAMDLNGVILGGQVVGAIALLLLARALRRHRRGSRS